MTLYATLLSLSSSLTHIFPAPGRESNKRRAYVHVIQTSGYNPGKATGATVQLNGGLQLAEGDGAFAIAPEGERIEVRNVGQEVAEVLLFDIE